LPDDKAHAVRSAGACTSNVRGFLLRLRLVTASRRGI